MFEDFIGQRKVLGRLLASAERGSLSHAYIFSGPRGIGKKTLADIFAAAIHCRAESGRPCGVCSSCVRHRAGTQPDKIVINEENKAQTGVEKVRELVEDIYLKPYIENKKVYIISDGDSMTEEAQNALLKVFEEPPSYAVIIIVSENLDNLLPTIRSRATIVNLELYSKKEIADYIREKFPEHAQMSEFIADFAGGIIGRAKALCSSEDFFVRRSELYLHLPSLLGGRSGIFDIIDILEKSKDFADDFFDFLLCWFRDCLIYKTVAEENFIINKDYLGAICDFASKISAESATAVLSLLSDRRANMGKYANYSLWIMELLINCWEELHGTGYRNKV